ncbi:MAG TPA: hypothetical protein VF889_07195 [Bacteroidota bacterium]
MKSRFVSRLSMLAAAVLLAAGSAIAQVSVGFAVRFGPPAPRYEYVGPAPYHGAFWVRGLWAWDPRDGRYEWLPGHWIAARPAYVWYDGGWYHGPRGWAWREGYWQHRGARHETYYRDRWNDRGDRYVYRDGRGRDGHSYERDGRGGDDR